jgi:hypothetical protein
MGEFPEGMEVVGDPDVDAGIEGGMSCKNNPPVLAGAAFIRKDAMVPLFLWLILSVALTGDFVRREILALRNREMNELVPFTQTVNWIDLQSVRVWSTCRQ